MTFDYRKYYFLEDYLSGEIRNNFIKNGYLLPEEFFCIIIWKANRRKTKIREKFPKDRIELENIIKKITREVYNKHDKNGQIGNEEKRRKLEILLKEGSKYGFRLSIASAILTILYPEDFTIYDYRVLGQLNAEKKEDEKVKDFTYSKDVINKYFQFFVEIEKTRKKHNLTLRDADRYLFGKSFYEDLKNLVK